MLGAFRRLLSAWETASPTTDRYELVAKALSSVHGVDKNPFAAAIARFRLMLAAMRAAGVDRLTERVDFPINIAVGDSLLHGKGAPGRQSEFDFGGEAGAWTYRTEDVDDYIKSCHILEYGTYHVVVANPPYITVKDQGREREHYRKRTRVALASTLCRSRSLSGSSSWPSSRRRLHWPDHRELIHEARVRQEADRGVLPAVDLTHVIDTSGAYIPGHGTPTVILIGRRRFARLEFNDPCVLGIRGEPRTARRSSAGHGLAGDRRLRSTSLEARANGSASLTFHVSISQSIPGA